MITDTMTYSELSKELLKLTGTLSIRSDGWLKKYRKEVYSKTFKCVSCQKIDTNLYFILVTGGNNKIKGFAFIYLLLRNNKWIAILPTEAKNGSHVDTEIYESHFFSRYNERFNIGKTGIDLMFQYFKDDINEFKVTKRHEHNNKTYLLSNIKNGMAICEVIKVGRKFVCFYKTCVSNQMLSLKQIELKEKIDKEMDRLNKTQW